MPTRVTVEDIAIPLDRDGATRALVRIYRARDGLLPVVLYLPGLADVASSDALARELAARLATVLLLPDDPVDPRESATLERVAVIMRWLADQGERRSLDGQHVVILGEGLGRISARLLAESNDRSQITVVTTAPVRVHSLTIGSDAEDTLGPRIEAACAALEPVLVQGKAQGISG
jgi:acetyl esterase/lipase